MCEPSHLHSLLNTPWASSWVHPSFIQVVSQLMNTKLVLHEDIRPGVRQPESNQASPDEHRRGHEDGDGLCDANKRTKNQVPQNCSQLTQSVAEPKACPSEERETRSREERKRC